MMERILREDRANTGLFRPIVAIGYTKDLTDFATVTAFLDYLRTSQIPVSTFQDIYPRLGRPFTLTASDTTAR